MFIVSDLVSLIPVPDSSSVKLMKFTYNLLESIGVGSFLILGGGGGWGGWGGGGGKPSATIFNTWGYCKKYIYARVHMHMYAHTCVKYSYTHAYMHTHACTAYAKIHFTS